MVRVDVLGTVYSDPALPNLKHVRTPGLAIDMGYFKATLAAVKLNVDPVDTTKSEEASMEKSWNNCCSAICRSCLDSCVNVIV